MRPVCVRSVFYGVRSLLADVAYRAQLRLSEQIRREFEALP